MNLIGFFTAILFATSFSFAEDPILANATGVTSKGQKCTYTVKKMNSWEGQIVIFLNSKTGNFRIELPETSVPLKEGRVEGRFEQHEIFYNEGVLSFRYEHNDEGGEFTEAEIVVESDLKNPVSASAINKLTSFGGIFSKTVEQYDCSFTN